MSANTDVEGLKREVWSLFSELQDIYLATADGDQPRLRPVTLIHLGDRLFFATGAGDAKTMQIKGNPKVEFCMLLEKGESKGTLRAECLAKAVSDMSMKTELYDKVSFMKEFWSSPEDERYMLFELTPKSFEYMPIGSIQTTRIKL